jgi:hypothetical protein|tara:strand:+ start:1206 stop:2096 length:891 start_codon:yes stop_codon:yes gene_type:complete
MGNRSNRNYSYTNADDPTIIKEEILMPSTIENIDTAVFEFLNEKLNIFSTTNKGWNKVPIVWVSAERSFQIKNSRKLRDKRGLFKLPVITLERKNINKDMSKKGAVFGNIPSINDKAGGTVTIARRIKQDKTANFARSDAYRLNNQLNYPRKNSKVVYQTVTVPLPVYIELTYEIVLRSEYLQQMNEMMTPLLANAGQRNAGGNHLIIEKNDHKYETFFDTDYAMDSNVSKLEQEERKYETKVTANVLGYLMGSGKNDPQPKIVYRENSVEVKFPRERVMTEDDLEHIGEEGFIRP